MNKFGAIIEARMTSSRLPGKVLMKILEKPTLELMIERVRRVQGLDEIIIATTTNATDDPIVELSRKLDVKIWRGSEADVLGRVVEAATTFGVDVVVEATGDCPLIDPVFLDNSIRVYKQGVGDCVSNAFVPSYPLGMDHYLISTKILQKADKETSDPLDREHVIRYVLNRPNIYKQYNLLAEPQHTYPNLMLTLDTNEDFILIQKIFEKLYPGNPTFDLNDIIHLIEQSPDLAKINAHVRPKRA